MYITKLGGDHLQNSEMVDFTVSLINTDGSSMYLETNTSKSGNQSGTEYGTESK
jgi:hypothetical protein